MRKSGAEIVRSIYAIYFMKGQGNHASCCISVAVPGRLTSGICAPSNEMFLVTGVRRVIKDRIESERRILGGSETC